MINKHYVTRQAPLQAFFDCLKGSFRQIWYASPVSGALYFNLQADQTWRTQDAMELGDRFLKDFLYP